MFWQLGFGSNLINSGTGSAGTGVSGKSVFSGNDSGLFQVDILDANALDPRFLSGTICLGSNNWANAGIDGCCDNARASQFTHGGYYYLGDDNILNPYFGTYFDSIGYPGYYSLASVMDYPTAVLLTTDDESHFAMAAVSSMSRGNDDTGNNGPCSAGGGTNPAPCDRRQGFFTIADVADGLPNAVDPNRSNVIPWQATPIPSIDDVNPVDPNDPNSLLAIDVSWTPTVVYSDGRARPSWNPTLAPTDPNAAPGTGVGDIGTTFGLVRYVFEAAADTDPNFTTPSVAITCPADTACATATSASVIVAPYSCLRLRTLFGLPPRSTTHTTADCRMGMCGDLGYSVTSTTVCLDAQEATGGEGGNGGSAPGMDPSITPIHLDEDLSEALAASATARVFIGLSGRRLLEPMASASQIQALESEVAAAQTAFRNNLPPAGIRIITEFRHIFSVLAEIDPGGLSALTLMPEVTRVELTRSVEPQLLEGGSLVGSDRVDSCPFVQPGFPSPVTIAILDSGIDWRHEALGEAFGPTAPKVIGGADCTGLFSGCVEDPNLVLDTSNNGHGTAVAGIAAGKPAPGSNYTLPGVATEANLLAVKVIQTESPNSGDLLEGLQWVLSRKLGGDNALKVVSMSVGIPPQVTNCPQAGSPLYDLTSQLSSNGVAVVSGAGNDLSTTELSSPACIPHVVSVGAAFDTNFGTHGQAPQSEICAGLETLPANPHSITCKTNTAPGLDLVAPSPRAATTGLTNGGTQLDAVNPSFGGTSGATPYVSGAFALMFRDPAYRNLTPQQIESRLKATGFPTFHRETIGPFPRINIARAMQPDGDSDGFGDSGACLAWVTDNCPSSYNPGQADLDGDARGDLCDNCPEDSNPEQIDFDLDGDGNACDLDDDNDGLLDGVDGDDDNDGILDDGDGDPNTPAGSTPCMGGQTSNCDDNCPGTTNALQQDDDSDGTGNACDCSPADSTIGSPPGGIEDLSLTSDPNSGEYRLSWDSQSQTSGTSTTYDVFSGLGSGMKKGLGDFSLGNCLAEDLSISEVSQLGSEPPIGEFIYFVVRAQNGCSAGTYGGGQRDLTAGLSSNTCQ